MEDAVHCNSNGFVMGVDRFWVMPDQVKSKHPVEGRGAIQIMHPNPDVIHLTRSTAIVCVIIMISSIAAGHLPPRTPGSQR
jgi:hypothetical protein